MMAVRRWLREATAVVSAALMLMGLSTPTPVGPGSSSDSVDISGYENVRAVLDPDTETITYPIDAYFADVEALGRITQANAILGDRCMRTAGRRYPPADFDLTGTARMPSTLYGIWSTSEASRVGYERTPAGRAEGDAAAAALVAAAQGDPGWSSVMDACEATTETLPSPGRDFYGDEVAELIALPMAIRQNALALASRSEEWTAARQEWLGCLTGSGLTVRTDTVDPWSPEIPQNPEQAIRTAVIDTRCKADTAMVERLSGLESRFQMAWIERHRTALDEVVEKERTIIERADEVISRPGG